ncbi:MAG: DEAD/DEAH box helicase [Bacteroidales bacterium]|nr:DEAD/DEAH box helicase [Bacteroidales bacterium]
MQETVNQNIIAALEELNFNGWTPIQEKVIPVLLRKSTDLIALAQTGTGKTAAYGVPLINDISNSRFALTPAVILSPTRELCIQIAETLKSFAKYLNDISIVAIYGGTNISGQINQLKSKTDILVATPGRLLDLIRRHEVNISKIKTFVIDEADKMFNMGFINEISDILNRTSAKKHLWLFSATMPAELESTIGRYLNKPLTVTAGPTNSIADNVTNDYYVVDPSNKFKALTRIIAYYPGIYAIIFCKTKQIAQKLAERLINSNFSADALHGDLTQEQRDAVMLKFRTKNVRLLIATDVAARGIDIDNLTHIIHYNVADDAEQYIHRSGRTARADKSGIAITLVSVKEQFKLQNIASTHHIIFHKHLVPSGDEITKQHILFTIESLADENFSNEEICKRFPNVISAISENANKSLENMSKEEIIKRIISLEINKLPNDYNSDNDINIDNLEEITAIEKQKSDDTDYNIHKAIAASTNGFVKLKINIGHKTGTVPVRLISLINDTVRHKVKIGKIDILDDYTVFEVESAFAKMVICAFDDREDRRYNVEVYNHTLLQDDN